MNQLLMCRIQNFFIQSLMSMFSHLLHITSCWYGPIRWRLPRHWPRWRTTHRRRLRIMTKQRRLWRRRWGPYRKQNKRLPPFQKWSPLPPNKTRTLFHSARRSQNLVGNPPRLHHLPPPLSPRKWWLGKLVNFFTICGCCSFHSAQNLYSWWTGFPNVFMYCKIWNTITFIKKFHLWKTTLLSMSTTIITSRNIVTVTIVGNRKYFLPSIYNYPGNINGK